MGPVSGLGLKRNLVPFLLSGSILSIWLPGDDPLVAFVIRETAMESPDRNSA